MESTSREWNQPICSGSENPHRTESAEQIETHPGSLPRGRRTESGFSFVHTIRRLTRPSLQHTGITGCTQPARREAMLPIKMPPLPPPPKEVRYRKAAGPGSLNKKFRTNARNFRSYHVSSNPSPDESQSRKSQSRKAANRPRVAILSPPSVIYAPYLLLGGQVPGIPDPAPFGRSVRSTCPAGRGFRRAAGWR